MKIHCFFFIASLLLHPGVSFAEERPNIIFILADDMGWNETGFTGETTPWTPRIDKLCEEGQSLTQFYVHSVCSPTRAAFLTGRYAFRTWCDWRTEDFGKPGYLAKLGMKPAVNEDGERTRRLHALDTNERTVAEALKDAGYFTAIVGKWHCGEWLSEHLPMEQGFMHQYGHYGWGIDYSRHAIPRHVPGSLPVYDWHRNQQPVYEEGYSTDLIADEVVTLIARHREQHGNKPFFHYVPFNAVHGPLGGDVPRHLARHGKRHAALKCLDDAVGRIVDAVDQHGFKDNTLIVFTNDNGGGAESTNAPYRGKKGTNYEGGVRVPCVLRWPGRIEAGSSRDGMMHIVDFYSTFLHFGKANPTQERPVDGMDMAGMIFDDASSERQEIVFDVSGSVRPPTIRMGDHKLIGKELYNVVQDPEERQDIAEREPGIYQRLKTRVEEVGAQRPPLPELTRTQLMYPVLPWVYGQQENRNAPQWLKEKMTAMRAARQRGKGEAPEFRLGPQQDERPNVVVILVDDLGWMDVNCNYKAVHGADGWYETPHVDRLAAEGIRLSDGYAACQVCSPTRVALQTGRYPARGGYTDFFRPLTRDYTLPEDELNREIEKARQRPPTIRKKRVIVPQVPAWLEREEVTIAEVLRKAGYATCHVGKWHLGGGAEFGPLAQGYQTNIGGTWVGTPPSYVEPYKPDTGASKLPGMEPWTGQGEQPYLTDVLGEAAANYITEHVKKNPEQSFFMHLATYSVHAPIQAHPELGADYNAKPIPDGCLHKNPGYASMVGAMDRAVGKVLDALDTAGVAENTLVIFTSDNGGMEAKGSRTNNAPLREGKKHPYEGGIREPWVIRFPGKLPAGVVSDAQVSTIDIFPTVCAVAGAPLPGEVTLDGENFLPVITGEKTFKRQALFWHYPHFIGERAPVSMVRSGKWKLLRWYPDGEEELYDLEADLSETTNLADAHPEVLQKLSAMLDAHLEEVDGFVPVSSL